MVLTNEAPAALASRTWLSAHTLDAPTIKLSSTLFCAAVLVAIGDDDDDDDDDDDVAARFSSRRTAIANAAMADEWRRDTLIADIMPLVERGTLSNTLATWSGCRLCRTGKRLMVGAGRGVVVNDDGGAILLLDRQLLLTLTLVAVSISSTGIARTMTRYFISLKHTQCASSILLRLRRTTQCCVREKFSS